MKPTPKLTFLAAGGVASALLVVAFAAASEKNHHGMFISGAPSGAPAAIEDIRARELKRLMRLDEDEDGKVTFEEFRARSAFAAFVPSIETIEAIEVEDVIQWSETLVDEDAHRIVIQKSGDAPAALHMRPGNPKKLSGALAGTFAGVADGWSPWDGNIDWFEVADANGDGALDRDEVDGAPERVQAERAKRKFERLDLNKDEALDEEDVDLRLKKLEALDEDGDGEVSHAEMFDLMRLLHPPRMDAREPMRRIRIEREHDRR